MSSKTVYQNRLAARDSLLQNAS